MARKNQAARALAPKNERKVGIGTALRKLGQRFGGIDIKIERDQTPATAIQFECDANDGRQRT